MFSDYLSQQGQTWRELPDQQSLASSLALVNQNYHEFCSADSVFAQLEAQGALTHRVGPVVAPGAEAEPFAPEVGTRAQARARWIRERAGRQDVEADWALLKDQATGECWRLDDPRSAAFSELPLSHATVPRSA